VLRELSEASGGTAVLRILDGDELLCLASFDSPASLRVQYTAGSRVPINFGSVGKVVMAFLPEERTGEMIAKGLIKRVTEKTVTDPAALKKQLAQIRLQGWVSTIGEAIPGTRGIAAPIWDDTGEIVGGIGLTFPAIALPDGEVQRVAKLVVKAAKNISAELGWKAVRKLQPSFKTAAK
jgi:DNA-binding IclR family transcriptional regulator